MTTPVTVIGGYLGAGKTTLINAMLRGADGVRIAVLVNEFGALSIDEDLIESQDGDVISIAGGCICCAFGDNLVGTFADLMAMQPRPDHIVIEASGVAIPASVAATLTLIPNVTLSGIVVLADAETVETRARDKYMGDTILRQIDGADLILVTKTDLVDTDAYTQVENWLRGLTSRAEIIPTVQGRCPNSIILGTFAPKTQAFLPRVEDHSSLYDSAAFRQVGQSSAQDIAEQLSDSALGLVRAKGFVKDRNGHIAELHLVGQRWSVGDADPAQRPGLVCIGLKARMDRDGLIAKLTDAGFQLA